MLTKTCSKCKKEYEATTYYFFKNVRIKDGLEKACKECMGHGFQPIIEEGHKICKKCNRKFPLDENHFSHDKTNKNGYNSYCRDCMAKTYRDNIEAMNEYHRQYYLKNKDRKREYRNTNKDRLNVKKKIYYYEHLKYFKKAREKAKQSGYFKEYSIKNKDKAKDKYVSNKENILKQRRKYYRENKEKIKEHQKAYMKGYCKRESSKIKSNIRNHKRTATLSKLPFSFTESEWEACKKYFDNKCACCGKEEKLTQDHFIAATNNGEYTKNNILPICKSCNSSKLNYSFFEWYPKQSFYNKRREQKILKYLNYDPKTKYQQLAL